MAEESFVWRCGGMIQITPQMRIMVAVEPVDFRRGIDGLARACREVLGADPFSGGLFVFRNRGGTAVKILVYDAQGFWLCHKRLSRGRFRFWPESEGGGSQGLAAHELQVLLVGGNPAAAKAAPVWRRLPAAGCRLSQKTKKFLLINLMGLGGRCRGHGVASAF